MGRLLGIALLLSTFSASNARAQQSPEHGFGGQFLYGYAAAGDDPARYVAEIEASGIPTNVASVTVHTPSDDVTAKVAALNARGQRAALVLDKLLFKQLNLPAPCGEDSWRQWLNYQDRFAVWLNINRTALIPERVAFVVMNTEVNNRCIDPAALDAVTRHVKAQLPDIPTVAGYGRSIGAKDLPEPIPTSLDVLLFYRYYVFDPTSDADYQRMYADFLSRLTPEQRVILVPEGFYGPMHTSLGWAKWHLGYLALNHARFAQSQPRVVGVIYLMWPDGVDEKTGQVTMPGTRSLPQSVRDRHREAGCLLGITNPFAPGCG